MISFQLRPQKIYKNDQKSTVLIKKNGAGGRNSLGLNETMLLRVKTGYLIKNDWFRLDKKTWWRI